MSDLSQFVQLPISGDLWRAPQRNENGEAIPRPDTVDVSNLPLARGNNSPDVAAILMAELQTASAPKPAAGK